MESGTFYVQRRNINYTSGPRVHTGTSSHSKYQRNALKCKGRRSPVWVTVSLGLICVLLLVFIICLNISLTAERDLVKKYKTTVQEFNHTINSLQANYTNLRTEEVQLKKNLSQKNLEYETRVNALSAEKEQLSQKKLELERNVTSLSDQLKEKAKQGNLCGPVCLFMSKEAKSWSESRQFCRDHEADLVMIKTEEKQRFVSSLVQERVWTGLTDTETEGNMTWVDNSTLIRGFWFEEEPNNAGGNEDCIELIPSDTILNWNDLPCSEMRKGICEK